MLLKVVLVVGVALLPLPALVLGIMGIGRRSGYAYSDSSDRLSLVVLVVLRVLTLLLVLALSAVVLLAAIGSLIRDVELHGMAYVLFVLDLLLGTLVLLTFGRRDRRPVRRPASPAAP